jgi:hypothetical protein
LKSFLLPASGSLVQPIIVIRVVSSINLAFHLANAFFILAGLDGSAFFFFFFFPFFLAGHTFSASSMYIIEG